VHAVQPTRYITAPEGDDPVAAAAAAHLRPTGRSLTVFWRRVPSGLMMNRPLEQHRRGEGGHNRWHTTFSIQHHRSLSTSARCSSLRHKQVQRVSAYP
jgi:hypothetical protein